MVTSVVKFQVEKIGCCRQTSCYPDKQNTCYPNENHLGQLHGWCILEVVNLFTFNSSKENMVEISLTKLNDHFMTQIQQEKLERTLQNRDLYHSNGHFKSHLASVIVWGHNSRRSIDSYHRHRQRGSVRQCWQQQGGYLSVKVGIMMQW